MIDRWLLPGPAALVATLVADLLEGRQLVLRAAPQPGLRRAVEDALALRQQSLRLIYDEGHDPASVVLLRAIADGFAPAKALSPGIYWVDDIEPARAVEWASEVSKMAKAAANQNDLDRALVVVPLPKDTQVPHGLGVIERTVRPLNRIDLRVATYYAMEAEGRASLVTRIRAALAEELSAALLPDFVALDALECWLDLPDGAVVNLTNLERYAAEVGLAVPPKARLKLALWRAQSAVLNIEIEEERLRIIDASHEQWLTPYTHLSSDGREDKCICDAVLLELAHLCRQTQMLGMARNHPLRNRLFVLRDARNALSHLEPLSLAELSSLMRSDN